MKKILHLSHTDIAFDSRILKEMNAALNSGYNVFGIGIKLKSIEIGQRDANKSLHVNSLEIGSRKWRFLPRQLKHLAVYVEFFLKSVPKAISHKADIIHCNDTTVLPIALVTKLFTRAKLVYDAHELESNQDGQSKLSGILIKFFEKISWRFIDGLIVVSPSIKKWYNKNIGSKATAIVLNSPILSEENDIEATNYLKDFFGIPRDELVFIYIGGLGPGRGIELIRDVFKDKSLKSHVVFMGYGSYFNELNELSRDYTNIHVHEAVTHDQVVSIAQSADVGLALIENTSLSCYYCLPNKLFEYCFAGIPVLASDFPDIRDVLETYSLGLLTTLEPISIKKAIISFEKKKVEVNFSIEDLQPLSWTAQARNLLDLYNLVLDK
jgi:glycosyltransferase involved in cell wall biosynthesis